MSQLRWLQLFRLIHKTRSTLAAISISLFQPMYAIAFGLIDSEVTEDDGVFSIKVSANIDAEPEYIRYVLADFAHIYRLSPSIIESEVLPATKSGEKQIRTRLLLCTSVFCTEAERVDKVRMLKSGDLEAVIIPELSEFKSGKARWKITSVDDQSHLVYEAILEPDFFIPPVLGTRMMIQNIRNEFTMTFIRIEKIASINQQKDRRTDYSMSNAKPKVLKIPCTQSTRASLQ